MVDGDYINDRGFRRSFHQWLAQIWQEKDDRIDAIQENTG